MSSKYSELPNHAVTGSNGVTYRYRETAVGGGVPLVLLQHFRGSIDYWDPALVDDLAKARNVITFDNVGVAGTTGLTPSTVEEMAKDAIIFIEAMKLDQVDILGFSIGSFVAQEIVLIRPALVRRLVLASAAPKGGSGMHGWAAGVMAAVGKTAPKEEDYLSVFFKPSSPASLRAGQETWSRMFTSFENPDEPTSWQTREAQYDAVCTWGIPNHALLQRVSAIETPVFIGAGDSDPMILPRYTYLLAGLIPGAQFKIYPDAAHGFLFQHHSEFAADVTTFLDAK